MNRKNSVARKPKKPKPACQPQPAIAVGGDDDRGDDGGAAAGSRHGRAEARLVGGRGDEAATDREDRDEQDGSKDARHVM